jgi:tetratricopeptide (TPR) repeat protein
VSAARRAGACLALVLLAAAVYWPVGGFGFIRYDDGEYVLNNPLVLGGLTPQAALRSFFVFAAANWHPLTWISHMLDVSLFGLDPRGPHLVNLGLHAANGALVFLLLRGLTGAAARSLLVAALFVAHPLHVQSVAWISERKDLLSTLLWLLAALAWVAALRRPAPPRRWPAAALFALALMAKPMPVTFPLLLLVLDFWPLGRWRDRRALAPLVREKWPLFALSCASAALTVLVQAQGAAVVDLAASPPARRLADAVVGYGRYVAKTLWPHDLSIIYLAPEGGYGAGRVAAALLGLALATAAAVRLRRSRPHLLAGWAWFLVTLLPVIGLVKVGLQAIADRYTYVPLVGLFVAGCWQGGAWWRARPRLRPAIAAAALALVAALAARARVEVGYWSDDVALFSRASAVEPGNYLVELNLGGALIDRGRLQEGLARFEEVVRLRPPEAVHYQFMGRVLMEHGLAAEGERIYEAAIARWPGDPITRLSYGLSLQKRGDHDGAARQFAALVALRPQMAQGHHLLGTELGLLGRADEAGAAFARATSLNPQAAEAWFNWGVVLQGQGRDAEAAERYRAALRANPGLGAAREALRELAAEP